jgi:hypothetical protein
MYQVTKLTHTKGPGDRGDNPNQVYVNAVKRSDTFVMSLGTLQAQNAAWAYSTQIVEWYRAIDFHHTS